MAELTATRPVATPKIVELPQRQTAVVRIEGTTVEMPKLFGEAFALTAQAIQGARAQFAGEPFGRYFGFGERVTAEVGFPFTGTLQPTEPVYVSTLPGGRAVTTTHVGPYEELGVAWERAQAWMSEQGLTMAGPPWECYLTGPDHEGPHVTEIFWPID
jgi:effector-binding domain-containing protein